MAIATTVPRYNKLQKIIVSDEEITLIEHLKRLRIEKNITKKQISTMIKQNVSWYSQIERNGKNGDDNRQRTIYRPDLINIISIIKYGATSISELSNLYNKSEIYIDKIIKAIPISSSQRELEWYEINNHRTPLEQDRLYASMITSITKSLKQTYDALSIHQKDLYLDNLKNINASLKIDPVFILSIAGLPFNGFLYEANQEKINALLKEVYNEFDEITIKNNSADTPLSKTAISELLRRKIYKWIESTTCINKQPYIPLSDDKVEF